MDKPISEAVVSKAADALCGEWNLHYPDAVRMATVALTAAQQQGGWDLKEVVCLACGDHIMPMGQLCHACSHPVSGPPSASEGAEGSYHPCTSILIEGLKRLEGGSDVLAEWDRARAKADTALAQQPAAVKCPHRTRCDCLASCKYGHASDGATQHQEPTT
jgi:hypothetical protein